LTRKIEKVLKTYGIDRNFEEKGLFMEKYKLVLTTANYNFGCS
jgi:hypothetical protein